MQDSISSPLYAEEYAREIKELSKKRRITAEADFLRKSIIAGNETQEALNIFARLTMDLQKNEKQFLTIDSLAAGAYTKLCEGSKTGLLTGFPGVDVATRGLQKQWFIVIAADSGEGKTTFALNMCLNIAKHKHTCLFFSVEMSADSMVQKIISAESAVPIWQTNKEINNNNKLTDVEKQEIKDNRSAAAEMARQLPIIFDERTQTIDSLYARARDKKNSIELNGGRLDIIFVDYIQLIQTEDKKQNREQNVADISRMLKTMAKEFDIPVVSMSQLNREIHKDKARKLYRMSDLRESAAIGNDADLVIFLNPEDRSNPQNKNYKLTFGKHRNCDWCECNLFFNKQIAKFSENCETFDEVDHG
jgi:replicative DNA helicase